MTPKNPYDELPDSLPFPTLEKSWLEGTTVFSALGRVLVRPLVHARVLLEAQGVDEDRARAIRAELEQVFVQWRGTHGKKPSATQAGSKLGLLGPYLQLMSHRYHRKKLTDIPPYHCAGPSVSDYTELFVELRGSGYEPLIDFLSRVSTKTTLAVLVLSEAARGNEESAILAREHLIDLEAQESAELARNLLGHAQSGLETLIRLHPIQEQARRLDRARRQGAKASVKKRQKIAEDIAYSIVQEAEQRIATAQQNKTLLDYRKLAAEIAEWGFTLFDCDTKRSKLDKTGHEQRLFRSEDTVRAALQKAQIVPAKGSRKRK